MSALFLLCLWIRPPVEAAEPLPEWIWAKKGRLANQAVCLKTQLTVGKQLRRAQCLLAAEYCQATIYLNGKRIGAREPYGSMVKLDVADALLEGDNTLSLCCVSVEGPAAIMVRLELDYADKDRQTVVTGKDWQAAAMEHGSQSVWPQQDRLAWRQATQIGAVVPYRWGLEADTVAVTSVDDYTQWMRAAAGTGGTDPKTFQIADGFEVELIRSAAKEEDSWISLTEDPQGRWVIGLEKQGLLRLTLPAMPGADVKAERINDSLHECRGLVFAHDSLYAMANNDSALFRLRDTDGNDRFDKVEKLVAFAGDAGHGRNQLALGPDGQVWGIFGDSVFEPESATTLPPPLARPTPAESTRSGFVARFNEDASQIKVVARGLRNPYGIDFNEQGELFTYDADAEYDMGASWYRPTRILHLLAGADFGWRRVTQQWPPYFPDRADMPQPTLDIGKGSPTAVAFGTKSRFPPRYRNALFALDWAYGRILSVHLTPRGSSYQASAETFLRGQPLNVTDIEFGVDGAMYFITGGRGTQSALYRVKHKGSEIQPSPQTAQERANEVYANKARAARHRLESFLEQPDEAHKAEIWRYLGSDDPWIRHAARAALEKLPSDTWRKQALEEPNLDQALAARIALTRRGEQAEWISGRLQDANQRQSLELLYLAQRILEQSPTDIERQKILKELRTSYPTTDATVNLTLSRILSMDPDEKFVIKTVALLDKAVTQPERLHYCFVLRNVTAGWTAAARKAYFGHLPEMDDFIGGEGLPTFRKLIRQEALASLPADDRPQFEQLLATNIAPWTAELPPARVDPVRKWTVNELADAWARSKSERDPIRGKAVFATARCIVCHRAGGPGGVSGPDLSSVARRFSPRDILTSMIEPSKAIDEKYAAVVLELTDGRVVTGRIAPGDYRSPKLHVIANLLEPGKITKVAKGDIVHRDASSVSPMPSGLLDCFHEQEILDLLAFLLSAERTQQ